MDDNDDSSIMGVGAGMTGDATRTGTGRAFGAAGTGVGTNTFSESTEAMKRLLFLSDGKAQPNVPISNISAINSSLRIWYWCESRRSHYSCYEYVAARSLRSSTEAEATMHLHMSCHMKSNLPSYLRESIMPFSLSCLFIWISISFITSNSFFRIDFCSALEVPNLFRSILNFEASLSRLI